MPDLRISDIAELTGMSMRYWQRRAAANDMPGVRFIETGNRRIYFVDRDSFAPWWQRQLKEPANMNFRRIKNVARAIRRICSCPSREAIGRARAMEQRMMLDDLTARVRASFTDEEWNAAKSRCEERLGFKIDVSTN